MLKIGQNDIKEKKEANFNNKVVLLLDNTLIRPYLNGYQFGKAAHGERHENPPINAYNIGEKNPDQCGIEEI